MAECNITQNHELYKWSLVSANIYRHYNYREGCLSSLYIVSIAQIKLLSKKKCASELGTSGLRLMSNPAGTYAPSSFHSRQGPIHRIPPHTTVETPPPESYRHVKRIHIIYVHVHRNTSMCLHTIQVPYCYAYNIMICACFIYVPPQYISQLVPKRNESHAD